VGRLANTGAIPTRLGLASPVSAHASIAGEEMSSFSAGMIFVADNVCRRGSSSRLARGTLFCSSVTDVPSTCSMGQT
jgi:hypothetical protein